MAAGFGLQLAVKDYALHVCRALNACEKPHELEQILRSLLLVVRVSENSSNIDSASTNSNPPGDVKQSYTRVLRETEKPQNAKHILEAALCQHMESISFSLLPVAASTAPKNKQVISLLQDVFLAAPAAAALQALTLYTASVIQATDDFDTLRPRTEALGSDLAAAMLTQRFAHPDSSGIPQLCKEISIAHMAEAATRVLPGSHSMAEAMAEQVAAALVSVVDRASQSREELLSPEHFIPHLLYHFVCIASAPQRANTAFGNSNGSTNQARSDDDKADGSSSTIAFMGDVCGRLCRRGYAGIVANSFWHLLLQPHLPSNSQQNHPDSDADPTVNEHYQVHQSCNDPSTQLHHQQQHQQHQQQQQQQQQQELEHPITHAQHSAAPSASSQQSSTELPSLDAAFLVLHAVQDPSAMDKLLNVLLESASGDVQHLDRNSNVLYRLIHPMWSRANVRSLLSNKLLLHRTVPLPALILLVQLLDMLPAQQHELDSISVPASILVQLTSLLAEVWSDKSFCTRLPLKQQAYITCALTMCIAKVGKGCLERTHGLLPAVLQGVSARLDNPVEAIRQQGMRMGNTFSRALDPCKPLLFGNFTLPILEEEVWHPSACRLSWQNPLTSLTSGLTPEQTASPSTEPEAGSETDAHLSGTSKADITHQQVSSSSSSPDQASKWSSDHESDSDDSLQPYDLDEEEDDGGLDSGDRPMQLRDLAAALRKSEDVNDKLRALRNLEGALLAAPDELKHYAAELARALLHVRAPDWAEEEARKPEDKPQVQRYRSMVALLVSVPAVAGAAFTSELYSPHLDVQQRMLILETLASAAQQMANPRLRLQAGRSQAGARANPLEAAAEPVGTQQVGQTRRWGIKSLEKQQLRQKQYQLQQTAGRAFPGNAFPAVALPWAAALLKDCDVERHGVDLFNRDPLLLGRLLITLATFVECVGSAPVAPQLAACVLELVRSPGVHGHSQPYVRRSALLASAQVVATLSPARLAGAMSGSNRAGSIDSVLTDQLQWLQSWAAATASNDVDNQCQQLASACGNLQGDLAARALESLENGSQSVQQSLPGLPNMQSPAMLIDAVQLGVLRL